MTDISTRQRSLALYLGLVTSELGRSAAQSGDKLDDAFWLKPDGQEIKADLEKTLLGLRRYQSHQYSRAEPANIVWSDGEVRLLNFKSGAAKNKKNRILLVPSLINGSEILDILPERSFARWLAKEDCDVYLIDWGDLTKDAELKNLDTLLSAKFEKIINWLKSQPDAPLTGAGYCMGGLLLAAAEKLFPDAFDSLIFIAAPWNFHLQAAGNFPETIQNWAKTGMMQTLPLQNLPAQNLQMIFASVDPALPARKFSSFAAMEQDGLDAKIFVAVEDWLNSGSNIPGAIMRHSVQNWYLDNRTAKGEWMIAGKVIDACDIAKPSLILIPGRDRIVPPASARALADYIPGATALEVDCGHISMMVSARAEQDIWMPLRDWVLSH